MAFQLRRGTNENRQFITPAEGELLYTTDTNRLYVGGKTGGEGALVTGGIAVGGGTGGGAVDSVNGQTGDVVLALGDLDGVVITGTPSDGQVLKYDSGTTSWVNGTGGGSASDSFKTIVVAGQSSVVADSATDTLTLVAGTNVTITTNATTDTITINSTASSSVAVLDDLTDVVITGTPTNGQVLKYDTGTSKWINSAISGSGTVNEGAQGSFAFYAANGTAVSGGAGIDLVDGILKASLPITNPGYIEVHENSESRLLQLRTATEVGCGNISFIQSYGTIAAPAAAPGSGVYLGRMRFEGYTNSTDYSSGAAIEAKLESTTYNTDPVSINFASGDGAEITFGFTDATFSTPPFITGASVTVSGVVSGTGNYNGTYIVTGCSGDGMTFAGATTGTYTSGGSVVNDIDIVSAGLYFNTTSPTGENLTRLRVNNAGVVFVGPTSLPENPGYTGRLVIVSLENPSAGIDDCAISVRSCFDGTGGQRLVSTRARGSLAAVLPVLAGDDLFSIDIHGNSTTVTDILSSRIVGMAEGTIGASIVPGKLILQTANSAGSLVDGLTVNSKQMTTFGGMAKIVSYADEAAAEAAVGGTPSNGMMYYDSGSNVAKMYGNSAWHALW